MAINVTGNIANIAVNTTSNVVTVSSSPVNVQLSATSVVSNTSVRQAINVSNLSGFGNLTYDSSNTSNGVIQYTGTSTTDVRNSISASSPVTYNQSSGVIGLEQTLDDLTLKKYQETVVAHGNSSGNIAVDVANGTIHTFTLTGNVTKITTPNIATGGSATIILTQDGVGNNILDTTTHPLEWVNWDFVNDFKSLDVTAGNYSILNILWDGSKYYASLVVDSEISPTSLTVSGNIVGGNIDSQGVITSTGDITSSANINAVSYTGDGSQLTGIDTNADVKAYIEANGLDATANLTTTASLKSTGALGLVVTGNATIGGNLDVTGNINSETVVDLFVEDRNITMQYGATGTPSANSQIFIDRGDESNTYIKWDEGSDKWKFSNDGTVEYEFFTYDGSNITAGNANIDTSVNIGENSGANATLTLHANTSTTVYPNVVLYAPGHSRMATQPTAFAARLSPNGIEVNGLGDANVTNNGASRGFTVDSSQIRMFSGSTTGTSPIQLQVQNESDFTVNPSGDLTRGKLRINKQGAGSIQSVFTDIVTYEDLQLFQVPFGQQVQLQNGASIPSGKTITGAGSIDVSGDVKGTTLTTDSGAAGIISASGNITTDRRVTGNDFVSNTSIDAQTMVASGNIDGANINANYFHGDGSNLTGIAGDISSVTAGTGLTGGGTSGAVTLNVGAGTGITANPDNVAVNMGDFTTSDLAEGTNLYFTNTAARSALSTTTTSASGGGALAYDSGTGVFTFTPADTQTDSEVRALLSVGTPATPSGNGSLAYDNSTGVFTLTPADVPDTTDELTEGSTNLYYTSARTDADIANYTGAIINMTGNLTTTANVSADNVLTDHVISDSGQPLQLKGQTNGIQVDKTITSIESRIFDADTTGYGVATADLGAMAATKDVPGVYIGLSTTAGSNTATAFDLSGLAAAGLYGLKQTGPAAWAGYMFGQASLEATITSAMGTSAQTAGWTQFSVTDFSSDAVFENTAYITGISGNTVTFSQNAKIARVGQFILTPGAFSSTQPDLAFTIKSNATLKFDGINPWFNSYQGPETFANTTLDQASYTISGTTVDAGNVVTRNSIDINSNPDSAIRTQRALLIGANATPDLLSVGTNDVLPATTTLGLSIEQDGLTNFGGIESTPQMKLMLNQYKDNALSSYTEYPNWTEFLGQTGNATVDMSYIGAPNLNFKIIGGDKEDKAPSKDTDVVGRVTWNAIVPGVTGGADAFHPPASITGRMPGSTSANATLSNVDLHFQSTYSTSFRNGANVDGGTIPRTFISSSEGNTIIAAKTDGKVTLRPVRDYGTTGTDTDFTENSYAHELHEYHEFLGAGFLSGKAGTLVEIQPKSGETGGSANFNYDSKGDATLRLTTHEANNSLKTYWDITNEHIGGNLQISQDGTGVIEVNGSHSVFTNIPVMPSHSNTALPTSVAGGIIYVTNGNNKPAYGDGTNWYYYDNTTVT